MADFEGELARLADPGNGIYTNILEHVANGSLPAPTVPFLGSFLTAIERTRVWRKGWMRVEVKQHSLAIPRPLANKRTARRTRPRRRSMRVRRGRRGEEEQC
jgi:hypothetical protein